jgi:cell division ATPase FtsA
MELSIRAKHQLSTLNKFQEGIPIGFEFIDYEQKRDKFNEFITPLVEETLLQVQNIVKNAGLKMSDINTCVLVGGTCRIPYIQDRLEKLIGKPVYKDIDPELAVCMGAALWKKKEKANVAEAIRFFENSEYKKAFDLFNAAADQNDSQAQYYIGECYYYGYGVLKDEREAILWYQIAAQQEYKDAASKLKELKLIYIRHFIALLKGRIGKETQKNNQLTVERFQKLEEQKATATIQKQEKPKLTETQNPLWSQLETAINKKQFDKADELSIRILKESANVKEFTSMKEVNRIPSGVILYIHSLWKKIDSQGVKSRRWFWNAKKGINAYYIWPITWLEKRLKEALK